MRVPVQNPVHDAPEGSGSLSMNDTQLDDATTTAFLDVIRHQRLHVARRERVQVERTVNRQVMAVVHLHNIRKSDQDRHGYRRYIQ